MTRPSAERGRLTRFALALSWACAAAALALVWFPEFRAHWASPLPVSASLAERGRHVPAREILEALARQSLGMSLSNSGIIGGRGPGVVAMADSLLAGQVTFPRQPTVPLKVPFEASNLVAGPPTHQLYVASLATADILLGAFRQTGDEKYLAAARTEIAAFAQVDRWRLLPIGLLWNDHALAASIPVLADYWSMVRGRTDLDPAHATEVLSLVARTGTRLARAENYTFRTNHGMMQSLALLQLAAAFPYLDDASQFRKTACERIAEQLAYYVSPEGPVLEHSAGYHMLGFRLLQILEEHLALGSCAGPPAFAETIQRARSFAAQLRRPDGSLPTYGNTDRGDRVPASRVGIASPTAASRIYPASGFAIRWHGLPDWPDTAKLAQTAVTWSNFPSRAHKLADDMSVVVYAAGEDWLVNTGYWPYGRSAENSARGWRGSNAPHWSGESPATKRTTVLRGSADSDRAWVVDVERRLVGSTGMLRRQVVAIDGRLWLVVDTSGTDTVGATVDTVWTVTPDKRVSQLADGDFLARSPASGRIARLVTLGTREGAATLRRGSLAPFAGWTVHDGTPTPTTAIDTSRQARVSPMVTVLAIDSGAALEKAAAPVLLGASSGDAWSVSLEPSYGATEVKRDGEAVSVSFADGARARLSLAPPPPASAGQRDAVVAAYALAASRHTRFPDLLAYRLRVTWAFLALLAAQEIVLRVLRRRAPRFATALRMIAAVAWLALGAATASWYLVR